MNFAAFQWRADKGYLPPPGSMPQPMYSSTPYWAYPSPQQHPCPSYEVAPPYYPCPVIAMPPPQQSAPMTPPPTPPPVPKKSETKKEEPKKEDKKPQTDDGDAKTILTHAHPPPSLRPGDNYLFPREHTMLHIFNKAAPVWDKKYRGQSLAFKIFKVSTHFTVKMVIERVLKGGDGKGWAATEVFEGGDGGWRKGTMIEWEGDKAKGTLEGMGWNRKKGRELEPVWLVIHKP